MPAFNISDWAMSQGIFEISEEKGAPLIIAIHPDELAHTRCDLLPAIRQRAHRSSVPVAIHFDHGATYEQILLAIQSGFTSVMIDGSMLPFEENVALTKRAVEAAHAVGLSVEGELGTIGKTDGEAEDGAADIVYTDPDDAVRFVQETGVDSLAVAIGTCHGIYPSWMKPELKLDLLRGDQGRRSTCRWCCTAARATRTSRSASRSSSASTRSTSPATSRSPTTRKMREVLQDDGLREPLTIQPPCIAAMRRPRRTKIDLFDAAGKADLY